MRVHATHEQWESIPNPSTHTPSVYQLEMGEHTGTHVDALSHMGREFAGQSNDVARHSEGIEPGSAPHLWGNGVYALRETGEFGSIDWQGAL
jgi:hypothetical protein